MLTFYADPHLGLSRSGNTTPRSSEKLRDRLFEQVEDIISRRGYKICLGDMFDTFSNNEHVLTRALAIFSGTSLTLSGNHDVVNQADKVGSLKMLDQAHYRLLGSSRALFSDFGRPCAFSWPLPAESVHVVAVPHVASQSLFEQSLDEAMETKIDRYHGGSMLLLHCNYDISEDWATETTLNLTPGRATQLLGKFDYIMLGHEHAPAEHLDGRLIVLGNTFPTSLGDISDKRIAHMDEGKLRFEKIWDASLGYAEFAHDQIPESTDVSFARVKGEVDPADMLEMTQAINRMWKRSPDLYCLKVDAKIKGITPGVNGESVTDSLAQLPAMIRRELEAHPAMLALWDALREEEDLTHD